MTLRKVTILLICILASKSYAIINPRSDMRMSCERDQLNAEQAVERYNWIQRCQDNFPQYSDEIYSVSIRGQNKRPFYPVFLNMNNPPFGSIQEQLFLPIELKNKSCDLIPKGVYLYGACLASSKLSQSKINYLLKKNDELSYGDAIERIEWAYACSHLGDVNQKGARDVKHDLIFQSYPDKLNTHPRYPIFADTVSGHRILAPTDRYAECNAGQYKIIGYRKVESSSACAVRRYQALHEGLITELEYEDLKAKHKAPQSLEHLRPVACDE